MADAKIAASVGATMICDIATACGVIVTVSMGAAGDNAADVEAGMEGVKIG